MFKKFFTYQRLSNLAYLAMALLLLLTLIRSLFSPTHFDQVLNLGLLTLVLLVSVILWQGLVWAARQQKKLLEIMRLRSEFIDMASYQLRNPASAIMSALSFWKEGLVDKLPVDEKNQFIDNLYRRSQQLGQVIRDILQASEFDTEKISFADKHLSVVDVASLAEKVRANFAAAASAKGLTLNVKNESKISTVKTFADYLNEALSNLVDNAIQYTKTGQVEIRLSNLAKTLIIEVTDTGLGIPVADQARIFSRFVHGTNVGSLAVDGSGLGLFLTKEIIEAHRGGKISFHSQEGQGSTFTIQLPTAK